MDRDLLTLVQQTVMDLITDYNNMNSVLDQQRQQVSKVQEAVTGLEDHQLCEKVRLDKHEEGLDALVQQQKEERRTRKEEIESILKRLMSFEKRLSERVQALEEARAKTDNKVEQLEHKVEQLDQEVKSQRMKDVKLG